MHTEVPVIEKQAYISEALFLLYICLKYAGTKFMFCF